MRKIIFSEGVVSSSAQYWASYTLDCIYPVIIKNDVYICSFNLILINFIMFMTFLMIRH